jgi:hypothetical protein
LTKHKHPEFPAAGEKQVYEDVGGEKGHMQPVTLMTKVEKRGQLEYVVTLTKDYNLTVGGKEAVQRWIYSVDPSNVTLIDQQGSVPTIK